jgi:hypothetical protein
MNPTIPTTSTIRSTTRARHLRRQAELVHPVVAQAFRRRASELELETWLRDVVFDRQPAVA